MKNNDKKLKIAIIGVGSAALEAKLKLLQFGHEVHIVDHLTPEDGKNYDVAFVDEGPEPMIIHEVPKFDHEFVELPSINRKAGIPNKHRKKRNYHD